jgi:hypothetical protein
MKSLWCPPLVKWSEVIFSNSLHCRLSSQSIELCGMSALTFKAFCCRCYQPLRPHSGFVLSCCEFVCSACIGLITDNRCLSCKEIIQIAPLHNPSEEISTTLQDPSDKIEELYNVMKFQVTHYKSMLEKASESFMRIQKRLEQAETWVHLEYINM